MKLMPPTEVLSVKEKQLAINLQRSASLDKELVRKRQELEELEAEFNVRIQRQKDNWNIEKGRHLALISSLTAEVRALEKKKDKVLPPLDKRWQELERAEAILKKEKDLVAQKSLEFDDKLDQLESRLSDIADRELAASNLASQQRMKQEGINAQSEAIKAQARQINGITAKLMGDYKAKDAELSAKQAQLELSAKIIKDKEQELKKITINPTIAINEKSILLLYLCLFHSHGTNVDPYLSD
jgi:DNA repair exonuclease SbcCD ATPase subunit